MNLSKPLNELTYQELCRHMAENQEIIEWNYEHRFEILIGRYDDGPNPLIGELILFCDKCKSPYSINVVEEEFPFCETCHRYSQISVIEAILPTGIDKYIIGLCRQSVRAATHCASHSAQEWVCKILDYIYGSPIWYAQDLDFNNPILFWLPYDHTEEFEQYYREKLERKYLKNRDRDHSLQYLWEGEPITRPDRNAMMKALFENTQFLIEDRDLMLHKLSRKEVLQYHERGMVIPRPISTFGIKYQ
jgi:hypothetical protein